MAKPYSMDLRERVVAAVEHDGLSCNQAAARFEVAVSTAIGWVNRFRRTGSEAPDRMGGNRPKKLVGEYRDWLLQRCGVKLLTGTISPGIETLPPQKRSAPCGAARP